MAPRERCEDRISIAEAAIANLSTLQLTTVERYVVQKLFGLFLLGESDIYWGAIHSRVAVDGQSECKPPLRLADDDTDEANQALVALEEKGLLVFDENEKSKIILGSTMLAIAGKIETMLGKNK